LILTHPPINRERAGREGTGESEEQSHQEDEREGWSATGRGRSTWLGSRNGRIYLDISVWVPQFLVTPLR